ncbi:MAG: LCCL domain-containing protein [Nitrospira sp.]|nr:LCCL domain-containing protein [Nitrospira sp.]
MRQLIQWCASSLLLLAPSLALAQQHLLVAEESTSAVAFRSQVGRVVTFICPANILTNREIWGTDVYHVDSPVCTAAAHAGLFTPGISGQVTIVIGQGAKLFEGTGRNGVKSSSYGPGDSTYSFIKSGEPGQIDWFTTLDRVPDDFHAPITVVCPPKGTADWYVWGTDIYTASSAICVAAVHAGAVTLETGGRVTVALQPKQETFIGSERNKILSQKWTNWDFMSYGQPYRLSAASLSLSGGGPRTIRLAGFTAAGSAPVIVPRKIQLSGFTAVGTATLIVPRSIKLPGWTGSGDLKTP